MSRRHKGTETNDNHEPIKVELEAENHPQGLRFALHSKSLLDRLTVICQREKEKKFPSIEKISQIVCEAFSNRLIEVDDKWVKIPRSYFESQFEPHFDDETVDKMTKGKGRPFIKRLFNKITDNEVIGCFKETLNAVKEKCAELYENVTQYAVCFLKGSNQAFSPDDEPYGKLSHYHRILNIEIPDLPSRKTLNNYMRWYVEWEPVVINENTQEKKEHHKHRIWEKLIKWIYNYLKKIAPQYVVAYA